MDIEETRLPGIGLRHDFVTRTGRRLGIVSQRNGERDLVVYDPDDPDACSTSIVLSDEESDALAELLAPRASSSVSSDCATRSRGSSPVV